MFETLYLDHRFADGASVRVGRQNLTRGDGFILTDGGPLDGSRVAYFNALDLGWTSGKSRLDLLFISDPYRDQYLPRIHDRTQVADRVGRERASASTGPMRAARRPRSTSTASTRPRPATRARPRTPRARATACSTTLGGRCTRDFAGGWSVKAELAGQAGGQQPERRHPRLGRAGLGEEVVRARARSRRSCWAGPASRATTPTTTANEGWDPLFSRYPKWSELYIYTLATRDAASPTGPTSRCGRPRSG